MINIGDVLVQYLTFSGTPLYALVGERIYLRAPATFYNDSAMIIAEIDDESAHFSSESYTARVMFTCYGGTDFNQDADAVYRALYDRMKMADYTGTAGRLVYARLESGYPGEREAQSEWPIARAIYYVRVQDN